MNIKKEGAIMPPIMTTNFANNETLSDRTEYEIENSRKAFLKTRIIAMLDTVSIGDVEFAYYYLFRACTR